MPISKDVIRDLLPVYAAGEASEATRALVSEACSADPDLRVEVQSLGAVKIPDAAPPADLGMASLKRTQRLLQRRTSLVGFCYFFTMAPLVLVQRPVPGARILATVALAIALGGWVAFLRNAQRLRATGLEPPRSRWPALLWQFGGWVVALSVMTVVGDWMGKNLLASPGYLTLWPVMAAVVLIGWRMRQFREPEEIFRTETLLTLAQDEDSQKK